MQHSLDYNRSKNSDTFLKTDFEPRSFHINSFWLYNRHLLREKRIYRENLRQEFSMHTVDLNEHSCCKPALGYISSIFDSPN